MDPQFAPRTLARPMHLPVVASISAVGHDMNVAVFRRFAVMHHLISSGQYKMEDIIASRWPAHERRELSLHRPSAGG